MMRRTRSLLLSVLAACGGDRAASTSPTTTFVPVTTRVVVSPGTSSVNVGATVTLAATVRDQRDSVMTGKTVTWSSSSAAIATVSASGVVAGVTAGSATITAAVDGKSGSAAVSVSAAPPSGDFQTTVPTIDLNVIPARPTASAITLSLYSGAERDVTVTLVNEGRTVSQHLAANASTTIELDGLAADRAYRYRVDAGAAGGAGAVTRQGTFRTARAGGSTFRFDMQADSHLDSNSDPKIYANTLTNMLADSADFLVDLGDTFMSEKYGDFRLAAAQYYAQRYYFGISGQSLPLYLVQGNHDGELGWTSANAAWASLERTSYFPPVVPNVFYSSNLSRNYYAWRWGDALFIALDPFYATTTQPGKAGTPWAFTLGKEQYDWLVSTLKSNTAPYTFVFLHNLVGGNGTDGRGGSEASIYYEWGGRNADGTDGFATQRPGWSKPIHDLLVQYKVSAVFHGHDHLYVHQARDGIAYQEVPQPSFARENSTASAVDYGYLSGTLLGSSGHIRVTVSPGKATVEYIRSRLTAGNGDVVDRYDILPAGRP